MKVINARGFTLVETMIYIALFGVLIGGAVVSAYQVLSGGAHNQKAVEIQQEGTFINRKINWEIAQADTASVSGGALVLEPGHVVFAQSGAHMTIARGASGTPFPLSSDAFALANTAFVVTPGTAKKPTSVRVAFDLGQVPFVFARYLRD